MSAPPPAPLVTALALLAALLVAVGVFVLAYAAGFALTWLALRVGGVKAALMRMAKWRVAKRLATRDATKQASPCAPSSSPVVVWLHREGALPVPFNPLGPSEPELRMPE